MTKNTEERIPEEDINPNSKIAREADAFLSALAGGADEDEADEAAFLALNPNGVVVDEEGDVLKKGPKSAIDVGTKVEIEEGEVEQELDEDDVDVFAYQIPQGQSFVDVSECVRQLVILQEPVAPVKNPDEDFIFVTNNQADGGDSGDKPMDPRWEKLKALKSKMENRS